MYVGDFGGASTYFDRARKIKINSPELMVAQGTLFLRRGEVNRAVEYYLEALEYEPDNKVAKKALQYIRTNSSQEAISELILSGKIKQFFPAVGIHPAIAPLTIISIVVLCFGLYFSANYKSILGLNGARADLSAFVLSFEEKANLLNTNLTTGVYKYILTTSQVTDAYNMAQTLFQQHKDNMAIVQVNKLLNSNASDTIKYKVNLLTEYFEVPTFETLTDNFTYSEVAQDPYLYVNCYVIWAGRITNVEVTPEIFKCDLLVGYENMKRIDGIVPVIFQQPVSIEDDRPLRVLGKITISDSKLLLSGMSVYQPFAGDSL